MQFFERLSLIVTLAVLVLAVLWPHVKFRAISNKFISIISRALGQNEKKKEEEKDKPVSLQEVSSLEHPRLSGRKLKRVTSAKEVSLFVIRE